MPKKTTAKTLPFKDINPRLGADELVKRLKACLKYVEECESKVLDDTLTTELLSLSATLVSSQIVSHKQQEVPLLSACILISIILLFPDDMPFGEDQSKKIFRLFIEQLTTLKNPALFNWSFALLENLSATKVFSYCLDIEASDILSELFAKIFSLVNQELTSKVCSPLMDILVDILQEANQVLPMEAFDAAMLCILEPQKSKNPAAYDFVCQLIKKTSLHLEHYVQIFFSSSSSENDSSSSLTHRLYDVIHALHQIDSTVLLSVLPQLENTLQTTDEHERAEVTRLLAKMFGAKDSQLSIENRSLWQSFLGRFQDVSSSIRCECVTFSKYFLVYHENLREDTAEKLLNRLQDGDEKVRLAAVKTITEVADEDLSCVPDSVFCALRERMRDRKLNVRKETIQSLCRVYRHVMDKECLSQSEKDKVEWIPNKLLHCLFQKIREDNILVTRGFLSCIIPVSLKPEAKMARLLHVYNSLDYNAIRAFEDFMKQRKKLRQLVNDIITIHQDEDLKENERKKLLLAKSVSINMFLPEPTKSLDHLREVVSSLSDLSHDLSQCVNVANDYSSITKAKSEVLSSFSSRSVLTDSIKALLDMSSPILVDRDGVKELVAMVTKELCDPSLYMTEELEEEEMRKAKNGLNLIKMLCFIESSWFQQKPVLTDLLTVLRHKDQDIVENSILSLTKVGKSVQECTTVSGCLQPILIGFATKATPRIAKLTVKCLHSVYNETDSFVDRLLKSLLSALDINSSEILTTLSSLSQIARLYPLKFCSKHETVIHNFIAPMILDVDNDPPDKDTKSLWQQEEFIQYDVRLKIASIKLMISWLIGLHNINSKNLERNRRPVFELLTRVLESDGTLDKNTSLAGMSRMRLTAAAGFLKLVRLAGLMECITTEQFELLSKIAHDSCVEVRSSFITKLYKGLKTFSLPLQYLSFFCLAIEASDTLPKSRIKEMLTFIIKLRRDYYNSMKKKTESPDTILIAQMLPEYSLSYVVYLISHHEKFSRTLSTSLNYFRDHLWFFLEPLVSKTDNYGFLQKLMDGIKETVCTDDPENAEMNKNVYAVCDLIMGILHDKKTTVTWGEFPGKVILPNSLYESCPKRSQPNDIRYLPPDYKVFPDKTSKMDTVRGVSDVTPKKRKRPGSGKKTASNAQLDSSVSDNDATPTIKKQTTPRKPATKKRSPKKQTKIQFKTKNLPVTSTPAVTVKPEKITTKRNAKRKVLQEDNTVANNSSLRRSPRKRTKAATDDVITSNELMNNIPEEEIDQQQEKEQEICSPPTKIPKNISSPSSTPVQQSEIKNRRYTRRRR